LDAEGKRRQERELRDATERLTRRTGVGDENTAPKGAGLSDEDFFCDDDADMHVTGRTTRTKSAWTSKEGGMAETLSSLHPQLREVALRSTSADTKGGLDYNGDPDAKLDFTSGVLTKIKESAVTAEIVATVKRAMLAFGDAARLEKVYLMLKQQGDDDDLRGEAGEEEFEELTRLRRGGEEACLRCAFDEIRLKRCADTSAAAGSNTKCNRLKVRDAMLTLLCIDMTFDQFDRMFRACNRSRDSDLDLGEFVIAFGAKGAQAQAASAGQVARVQVPLPPSRHPRHPPVMLLLLLTPPPWRAPAQASLSNLWVALEARGMDLAKAFTELDGNHR
jgi:hypothetical protein